MGTLKFPNMGTVYVGHWENDFFEGYGILYFNDQTEEQQKSSKGYYEGWFKNGKKHGMGTMVHLLYFFFFSIKLVLDRR